MYIHNIKINKPITEYIKTNNARELRNEIAIHVMYIEDYQWFDVEYGIYFTRKTGFFILSRVQSTVKCPRKER